MTLISGRETRQRLSTCLDKLGKIRPTDLIRESTLGSLNFRAGIPFFERTLTLYRQIAASNLSRVPSAILEIAVKHTEESLNQFEQIEAFNPAGMDRPEQIRNLLINDVRDAHAAIYEDLCIIIAPSRGQMERLPQGPSRRPMMTVLVLVLIAAVLGYHFSLHGSLINYLADRAHNLFAR